MGYIQKQILLLYNNTQRLQIYSAKYGQIFKPECTAYTSGTYQRPGAASLCDNNDKSTPSTIIRRTQAACVAVKECDLMRVLTKPVMCETDEAEGGKVDTDKEVDSNISQPAPEAMVDEDLSLPSTPPVSEIILEV